MGQMKKIYFTAIITVSFLIWSDRLQAQGTGTKLNQVELIKQFAGNWKAETGKDTTAFWEIKSDGTGLDCDFKYITKGKMIFEGKQVWDYDQKTDKFILSSGTDGMEAGSSTLWFTSKNKSVIIMNSEISNPETATFKLEMEFKSPDLFLQKSILNNNIINTVTFNRLKN
jgi:hypothetical protein